MRKQKQASSGRQAAGGSEQTAVLSGPPVDHYKPSNRKFSKTELMHRMNYAAAKQWSLLHKRQLSPLPLPEGIEIKIRQWFELVDEDKSGQLSAEELEVALKTSGIPADADAILEIIKLFDFDHDGEINWKEFHHFLCYEVMADKDPLGAEYVLPSGMALPIGSMIGAIRRRKLLGDVQKGGDSRMHWVSEGPEFLRHLLESERYDMEQGGLSREVLQRILSYRAPPSKRADPVALERHRRRIARLRWTLLGSASTAPRSRTGTGTGGGSGGGASEEGEGSGGGGGDGGGLGGGGSRGGTGDGAVAPGSRCSSRGRSVGFRSCTVSGSGEAVVSPRSGFEAAAAGIARRYAASPLRPGASESGVGPGGSANGSGGVSASGEGPLEEVTDDMRRAAKARLRAAAALMLLEAALEEYREEQQEQQQEQTGQEHLPGQPAQQQGPLELQHQQQQPAEGRDESGDEEGSLFLTSLLNLASSLSAPPQQLSPTGEGSTAPEAGASAPQPEEARSAVSKEAAAEAVGAIVAAARFVGDIERVDALLEQHHRRTGIAPPRLHGGANVAVSSRRAGSPRVPVVMPLQASLAADTVQPVPPEVLEVSLAGELQQPSASVPPFPTPPPSARWGPDLKSASGVRPSDNGGLFVAPAVVAAAAARLAIAEETRRTMDGGWPSARSGSGAGSGTSRGATTDGSAAASSRGTSPAAPTVRGGSERAPASSPRTGRSKRNETLADAPAEPEAADSSIWDVELTLSRPDLPGPSAGGGGGCGGGAPSLSEALVPRLSLRPVQRSASSGPTPGPFSARLARSSRSLQQATVQGPMSARPACGGEGPRSGDAAQRGAGSATGSVSGLGGSFARGGEESLVSLCDSARGLGPGSGVWASAAQSLLQEASQPGELLRLQPSQQALPQQPSYGRLNSHEPTLSPSASSQRLSPCPSFSLQPQAPLRSMSPEPLVRSHSPALQQQDVQRPQSQLRAPSPQPPPRFHSAQPHPRPHSPQPRMLNGRAGAAMAAGDIRRHAWSAQQGVYPQGPHPPGPSTQQWAAAASMEPTAAPFGPVPSGNAGLRPTGSRAATHTGVPPSDPGGTAAAAAAASIGRFAGLPGPSPDPRQAPQRQATPAPPAGAAPAPAAHGPHVQTLSPGGFGMMLRVMEPQPPRSASASSRARQAQSPSRGSVRASHGSLVSPRTGQHLDHGVEVVPMEWMAATSPRSSPRTVMSSRQSAGGARAATPPRAQASAQPPGSSAAAAQTALVAVCSGGSVLTSAPQRRSFELDNRTAIWRSAAGGVGDSRPPSQAAGGQAAREFSGAPHFASRGRLMRTQLAASFRASTPAPPGAAAGSSGGGAGSSGPAAAAGGPHGDSGRASASSVSAIEGPGVAGPMRSCTGSGSGDGVDGGGSVGSGSSSAHTATGALFGATVVHKAEPQRCYDGAAGKQSRALRHQPSAVSRSASGGGMLLESPSHGSRSAHWPWPWECDLSVGPAPRPESGTAGPGAQPRPAQPRPAQPHGH